MPTANATSSPVNCAARLRLHGGAFMNVSKTTWRSTAGDAATQRWETYFQAPLPFFAPTAKSTPELLAKNNRP